MYRVVVSDMDETFLDSDHRVPAANVCALERMRELGMLFVASSGRPYPSVMDSLKDLDPALMQDSYVISYNGGFIHRFGADEPVVGFACDPEIAEQIYQFGREHQFCQHVYTASGRFVVTRCLPSERAYLASLSGVEYLDEEPADLSFVGDDPITKVLYMSDDFDYLRELGASLEGEYARHDIYLTYSSSRYVEFVPNGIDKGTGLLKLAKLLDIDVSETIGVGDSANDLDLIKTAGLGVGVANVSDELRPYCDVVLDTRAEDGAFGELVERFLER